MHIPLVDLAAQYAEIRETLEPELIAALAGAAYVGGSAVGAFESGYANYTGSEYCVGVANGTDAVELALRAVGVTPGDEVVVPANTFIATAEAVVRIGAVPVLVDVSPDTLLIDPMAVQSAMGPRTRAVVPVHLFGQVAPVEQLEGLLEGTRIAIVGDAAQAQGATRHGVHAGAWGRVTATSFYPGKNLGAAGDAGAVTTSDPEVANRVRLMANHGSESKYVHEIVGFNSRLDALQALVLLHKLRRLDAWNERRRALARRYTELLQYCGTVALPYVDAAGEPVWHLYVIQVDDRDAVITGLHERGIGAGIHYPLPIHLTPAFRWLGHQEGDFPVAEAAAARILSLPIHPHMTVAQQDTVVSALAGIMARMPAYG
jgi:dTDP-4-amino-4,6-dideoxygalactose transaminase